jgi:hypothetical protein
MAFGSSFTRKDTAEGAEFEVKPAMPSPGFLIFAVVLTAFMIEVGSIGDGIKEGMLYITLPLPALIWVALLVDFMKRQSVTITVGRQALKANGVEFPMDDIAELIVKSGENEASSGPIMVSTASVVGAPGAGAFMAVAAANITSSFGAAAASIGQSAGAAQARRSCQLMLRRRSRSKPVKLVYGLTPDTAQALMHDLISAMR